MKNLSHSTSASCEPTLQDHTSIHYRNGFAYKKDNEDGILRQGIIEPKFNNIRPGNINETIRCYQSYGANFYLHASPATQNKLANNYASLIMGGIYPLANLSYRHSQQSNGILPGAEHASAKITRNNEILFKWADNSGVKTANSNDQVIIVTYFPLTKQIVYTLHAATRSGCEALLPLDCRKGKVVETWITFSSRNGRETGDCVYAGRVSW
jgi:Family of unknown function (DUF6266)